MASRSNATKNNQRVEKLLCPACGRRQMALLQGWIDGKAAECRACHHRLTNAEWREYRSTIRMV